MLMKAILSLKNEEDSYRFFEDLFTIPEIKSISQRLEVAYLLDRKETYQKKRLCRCCCSYVHE
jgi:TrpR-related protein YerC/YecD